MLRSVLLAALFALAASAPAVASVASGGAVDFEQPLPPTAAFAASGDGPTATPAIAAPRPFDLLGLRWRGGEAHVEARVQRADGRWSRWQELPHAEDVAAGSRRGETVTGPLWTGRAQRYQLRGAHDTALPAGLRAHFVAVERSGATAPPRPAKASVDAPAIVPRSQWDPTGSCAPRTPPRYGRVDFSVVHHTESLTSYSRAQAPEVVLGICRFHRNGNGWLDIGYNLLVDRFGTVYEGRVGGVEQPVIGAHAGGWNSLSTGVAVIGSFTGSRPPQAAQDALTQVLAWKLQLAGVPAQGTIGEISPGGAENRWSSGTRVAFQRIAGHRDADHTDCPGGAFYALLPRLRGQTANQHEIAADLLTNSPVGGVLSQGGPAALTGRLALAGGQRPVGAPLTLQQRTGEDWSDLDELRTRVDGVWSASLPVTVNGTYRVVSDARGVASPGVRVEVAAGVTARVSPQLLRPGRTVTLRGASTPAKERVTVVVERQTRRGAWRRVRRLSLATDAGSYETTLVLAAPGVHRFLVTTAADAANAAGAAPVRTASVRRARRAR
ncbi:N-acetylmuramoyl-L-alanine amidase [Conexibacter woesei]|uniref:N-acetylmuramoyl-L-alanine amidase family 2 n=1 Tax=Conexibacter woesei (strain DSM 14684 / CCUG 47730 / CIP 108061 / JCM 11494 / NBRC 100937 / ID131577) TaxID=469383 RepID=D3F4V7_CONWI|nr:N-acetylmuramoyl-L-alanine amidase [Conexibacter woesei]ADB48535.1 N-acetylmuramoyl-L-alanine amidase family 2 [Conexibacter woesei DSM 14684]